MYSGAEALTQLSSSAAGIVYSVLPWSIAALRPAAWLLSQILPIDCEKSPPLLSSMTFFS